MICTAQRAAGLKPLKVIEIGPTALPCPHALDTAISAASHTMPHASPR